MFTRRQFFQTLSLLALPASLRAAPTADLQIEVERGAWGQAAPADIAKVAKSAADEIWKFCPQIRMEGIRIYHRPDFPQTDFGRAADGRISIGLAVQNPRWAQLAFQFAHEFGHALAQQSSIGVRGWHESKQANLWLEESLCEMASLFALRRMAVTWKTRAPYPQWRGYASALSSYAADRMAVPANRLPKDMTFQAWFAQNEAALRKSGLLREKNVIVATQLLPLFEAAPGNWAALPYLNIGPRLKQKTTAQKFADWQAACPPAHKAFIGQLAGVFGVVV